MTIKDLELLYDYGYARAGYTPGNLLTCHIAHRGVPAG
jgi:hypothetical protein